MDRTGQNEPGLADTDHHQKPPSRRVPHDEFIPEGFVKIDGDHYPLSFALDGSVAGCQEDGRRALYVITAAGMPRSKVGLTDDIAGRLDQLQAGSPVELQVFRSFPVQRAAAAWMERYAHRALGHCRLHGEWFDCPPEQAAAAVKRALRYRQAFKRFWNESLHTRPEWRRIASDRRKVCNRLGISVSTDVVDSFLNSPFWKRDPDSASPISPASKPVHQEEKGKWKRRSH